MKGRKVIVLIAALAAPVAVFLFLKFFGTNEFAVEPLFQDAVPENDCNVEYQLPYRIPDSVRSTLPFSESTAFVIVGFPGRDTTRTTEGSLRRLADGFANDPVAFVRHRSSGNERVRAWIYLLDEGCSDAASHRDGTIRGRYALLDRKEADRLSVELKIMLRKY